MNTQPMGGKDLFQAYRSRGSTINERRNWLPFTDPPIEKQPPASTQMHTASAHTVLSTPLDWNQDPPQTHLLQQATGNLRGKLNLKQKCLKLLEKYIHIQTNILGVYSQQ